MTQPPLSLSSDASVSGAALQYKEKGFIMGFMAVSLTVLVILFLILGYLFFSQRALNRSVKGAQPLWPLVKPDNEGDPSAIMSKRTNTLDERTAKEPEGSARPVAAAAATISAPAKKPAAKKAPAKKPAAKKPVAKKTASVKKVVAPIKAAAPKAPAKAAVKKPAAKTSGPERLKKPNGKADDLKQISGVGPKLEKTLNGLGFWHFAQIAKWKKADVAIVDNELTFKGRIERDDWISQAKVLAKKK